MKRIKLLITFFLLVTFCMFSQDKKYEPYTVLEGETLASIANKFSITPYDLIKLNPELSEDKSLEMGKILIVPNKNYDPSNVAIESGKDYIDKGFLFHKVLPKENFFRLKKEFGVSKRILRKHNPVLRVEDLKAGQIIKFPVPRGYKEDNIVLTEVAILTKPYLVRPRETKHGISRRYGISIEKLEELNPSIKIGGLKMADIILVPDTDEIPDPKDGFSIHRIEKGETFYSLGVLFEMTEEELITINPVLNEGVKEGVLIRIPSVEKSATSAFIPSIIPEKGINAILMLPLMSNTSDIDFEKNRTIDIATDFYLGAMMALDSLKEQGLSVNMKVFDTQNSKKVLSSLLASGNLVNADLMIGPLFFNNVQFVAGILKNQNIAIVSPISQKDHTIIPNTNLVQTTASEDKMIDKVLAHIKDNYTNENILIVTDTIVTSIPKVTKILSALQPLDSLNKIKVLLPKKGYIKRELFIEAVKKDRNNFIVMVTNDAIATTDIVQNLGTLPKETQTILFGLHKGSNFKNISPNALAHVNFHYTASTYIDKEDDKVNRFIVKYNQKNFTDPSEYAILGFDVTYDMLLRLATYETISRALNAGYSNRASSKFQYVNNGVGKGFTNQGVYLMKYDGFNIVKVEEEIEKIEEGKE